MGLKSEPLGEVTFSLIYVVSRNEYAPLLEVFFCIGDLRSDALRGHDVTA